MSLVDLVHKQSQRTKKSDQQISDITKNCYNKDTHILFLCQKDVLWLGVLSWKNWSMLKQLQLSKCKITDQDMQFLANMNWSELTNLGLYRNLITEDGIRVLLKNKLPEIKKLNVGQNKINQKGMSEIICKLKNRLQQLWIWNCSIKRSLIFNQIQEKTILLSVLSLSYNKIGGCGIKWITKLNMPLLQELYMTNCQISGQASRHLIKGKWPKLRKLDICQNTLKLDNIWICQQNNWSELQYLGIIEDQAIGCYNCLLISSHSIKIQERLLQIPSKQLKKDIISLTFKNYNDQS